MSEYRKASQIVNNFFTLASIIIISIVLVLYTKYFKKEEIKAPHSNLECQIKTKTIDRISSSDEIKYIYESYIKNGQYILDGGFIKPRFGKFYLKDIITIDESDDIFKQNLKVPPKNETVRYVTIKYEIIENDKNDPRKIEDYDKTFAGTLLTSFRFDSKEIFMMRSDFLDYSKKSINERIECTIKAFKQNATN